MVSFTLLILDLVMGLAYLHLPVLTMWIITVSSILLTVVFWYCDFPSANYIMFKSSKNESATKGLGLDKDPEKNWLSKGRSGGTERETKTYGAESTSTTNLAK